MHDKNHADILPAKQFVVHWSEQIEELLVRTGYASLRVYLSGKRLRHGGRHGRFVLLAAGLHEQIKRVVMDGCVNGP